MKRFMSLVVASAMFVSFGAATVASAITPEELALVRAEQAKVHTELEEGNHRFVTGTMLHPHQDSAARTNTFTNGQHPGAVVVSCSDSRVPPEVAFDQGLGDVFVIRTAGHVVDNAGLASIEYAVEHLGTKVIVVMGHKKCGAVTAAVDGVQGRGHLHSLTSAIMPAVQTAKAMPTSVDRASLIDNAIHANVDEVAAQLVNSSPIIAAAVKSGEVKIVGAYYNLDTGVVDFQP